MAMLTNLQLITGEKQKLPESKAVSQKEFGKLGVGSFVLLL